jgi:AcrR family transcriptional regulator
MTSAIPAFGAAQDGTHQRIVEAALDCILEFGFYRASSNEIARKAGMTWGAIQYYFGSRERLLLAALEVSERQFAQLMNDADISGRTTAERLEKLGLVLCGQYGRPRYLATLQIVLNLAHSPETSVETEAALQEINKRLTGHLAALFEQALGADTVRTETAGMVFHAFRGIALSYLIGKQTSPDELLGERNLVDLPGECRRIAQALALFIDR